MSRALADVILSDAPPDYLALYPVLLLVGDHDFARADLSQRLLAALRGRGSCDELLLHQHHHRRWGRGDVDAMGPAAWAALAATGKASVSHVPGTSPPRVPAIGAARLRAIGRGYLPVVVANVTLASGEAVDILWQ
eukprot:gene8659-7664_t